jgi:hypothetical protein
MPSPETTAIVRNDLGTIAWEYLMDIGSRGFVGLKLMPTFETPKKAGEYPIITTESMLKVHKTERAARAAYNRSDYTFGKGNFTCAEQGFEELLDDTERELYGDAQIDCEAIAVLRALNVVLTNQEIRILTKLLATASIPNAAVGVSWDTAATATPRKNVIDAITLMRSQYGVKPNKMVISMKSKNDLLLTDEITDALKYTNPIELGGEEAQLRTLASYFGVEEVMVANAQIDAAKRGQSKSLSDLWTNSVCGLYRVSSTRDLKQPSIGKSFLWTGDSPQNIMTEQYRAESNRSDVFRTRQYVGEEYTFTGAGRLLTGV